MPSPEVFIKEGLLVKELFDVGPRVAADLMHHPRVALVDVREPWETERAYIPGACLIPLAQLFEECHKFPAHTTLLILCHHGVRSLRATIILRDAGLSAWSVQGGIERWALEIDPSVQRY